jgi:CRP-like cAMP-binding protein
VFVSEDDSSQVYLVLRGLVQVAEPARGLSSVVGAGEVFGFCDLVFGRPALFSYRACADSWIGRIGAERFIAIVFGLPIESVAPALDFILGRWWGGTLRRAFTQMVCRSNIA